MPRTLGDLLLAIAVLVCLSAGVAPRAQELPLAARRAVERAPAESVARLDAMLDELRVLLSFDLGECLERAEHAVRLAQRLGERARQAAALSLQARALVDLVGPEEAREKLDQARALLSDRDDLALRAEVRLAGAMLHWTLDEMQECMQDLRRTMELAELANAHETLFDATTLAWSVANVAPRHREDFARIEQIAAACADPRVQLELRVRLALTDLNRGVEGAADLFEPLLAEARHLGDRLSEGFILKVQALACPPSDLERSEQLTRASLAAFQAHGSREQVGMALDHLAHIAMAEERYVDACDLSGQAIEQLEGMGMHAYLRAANATAYEASMLAGRTETARAFREQMQQLERQLEERAAEGREALWADANQLHRELNDLQASHRAQLADMDTTMTSVLLAGGGALLLLVGAASVLLFRAKRRTDVINRQLQKEILATEAAQAERQAIEANLHQLERLDSIGMLAGGFAHDFNNILVGIRGNAQLALTDPALRGEQREMIEQVVASSDRAAGLCKDILAYAHAGSTPRTHVDLREILEGVLPLARAGFGAAIELEVRLGGAPCMVDVDRAQIEQVFLNILVNAGDAIDRRGAIRIAIGEHRLPGEAPSGHWFGEFTGEPRDCFAVSIEDTGQGMDAETIRRIFDPFFSTRFPGRGLGLAATYGILRRHHGVVNVQSTPGHGSTFVVFLPRSTSRSAFLADEPTVVLAPQATPQLTPTTDAGAPLVLVVDDEPAVRRVTERALRKAGYEVVTAGDAQEALRVVDALGARIDAAVIDYTMPAMDGAALVDELRARLPDVRTLLMSGQSEQLVRSAAPDCALLPKPFDTAQLVQAVRALQTNA